MDFFSSLLSWIMVVVWIAPAVGRFSLTSRIIFNPFSSSTEHNLPISLPLCPSFLESFHRVPGVASITTTILLCWNSIIADIQSLRARQPTHFPSYISYSKTLRLSEESLVSLQYTPDSTPHNIAHTQYTHIHTCSSTVEQLFCNNERSLSFIHYCHHPYEKDCVLKVIHPPFIATISPG